MRPALEIPVTFQNQRQQLVGMWHTPHTAEDAAPAVLMCHGFTGHKGESHRIFVEMARALASIGIGAMRFDFRGSGDSYGDFVNMTVSSEVSDARAALNFLRMLPEVDEQRIAMLGLSLGGLVTALTLGEESGIDAAVLWNPVSNAQGIADRRRTEKNDRELASNGVADYGGWAVGRSLIEELPTLRPVEALAKARCPVLIMLGDEDQIVPNEEGLAYHASEASTEVCVIEGGGHTFESLSAKKQTIEVTASWLTTHWF